MAAGPILYRRVSTDNLPALTVGIDQPAAASCVSSKLELLQQMRRLHLEYMEQPAISEYERWNYYQAHIRKQGRRRRITIFEAHVNAVALASLRNALVDKHCLISLSISAFLDRYTYSEEDFWRSLQGRMCASQQERDSFIRDLKIPSVCQCDTNDTGPLSLTRVFAHDYAPDLSVSSHLDLRRFSSTALFATSDRFLSAADQRSSTRWYMMGPFLTRPWVEHDINPAVSDLIYSSQTAMECMKAWRATERLSTSPKAGRRYTHPPLIEVYVYVPDAVLALQPQKSIDEMVELVASGLKDWQGWNGDYHLQKRHPYKDEDTEGEDASVYRKEGLPLRRVMTVKDLRKAPQCEACGWTNDMLDSNGF